METDKQYKQRRAKLAAAKQRLRKAKIVAVRPMQSATRMVCRNELIKGSGDILIHPDNLKQYSDDELKYAEEVITKREAAKLRRDELRNRAHALAMRILQSSYYPEAKHEVDDVLELTAK